MLRAYRWVGSTARCGEDGIREMANCTPGLAGTRVVAELYSDGGAVGFVLKDREHPSIVIDSPWRSNHRIGGLIRDTF